MDQPLDLSRSNHDLTAKKKKIFTIDYLTSYTHEPSRSTPPVKTEPCFHAFVPPLHSVENQYSRTAQGYFGVNEHVVPNTSSPPVTSVSDGTLFASEASSSSHVSRSQNGNLEMVNGGHGVKNPLFDCATEALQIQFGRSIGRSHR